MAERTDTGAESPESGKSVESDKSDERRARRGARRDRRKQALYSDSRRGLIASVTPVPIVLVVIAVVVRLQELPPGGPLLYSTGVMLGILIVLVLTMAALALYAFSGLRGPELHAAVSPSRTAEETGVVARVERRPWLRLMVTGGSAPVWSVQLSLLSLVVAIFLATSADMRAQAWMLVVVVGSLVANVVSIWVAYAVQYARLAATHGGLEWPERDPPLERTLSDYLYLSAICQIAYSANDVHLTTPQARRLVMSQVGIGFVLNAVVIAILVSVLIAS